MSDTSTPTSGITVDLTHLGVAGSWIGPPLVLPLADAETVKLATTTMQTLAGSLSRVEWRVLILHLSKLLGSLPETRLMSSGGFLLLLGSALSSVEKLSDEK